MARFGHEVRIETGAQLRVDPRVVMASQVLQLNSMELEQYIESELNENPALERLQDDEERMSDEAILQVIAPDEFRPQSDDYEVKRSLPNDETLDWLDFASSSTSLWEHLEASLLPQLPPELRGCGQYAVQNVNERGYFESTVEDLALETGVSLEEAEAVLRALQTCEPHGVGARDVRECLILQLQGSEEPIDRLARAILTHHMDDFIARKAHRIARRFKIDIDVVEQAFGVILGLNPYPAEGYQTSSAPTRESRAVSVIPDLVIDRTEQGWVIEVKGAHPASLALNREYKKQFESAKSLDVGERRHISTYVSRAQDFIQCLQQRRATLMRIGEYLVQHQAGFVTTGEYQYLRALTRSKMAADLNVHESTMSRATQGKFVQLPNKDIVPFEVFFKPALRVQKMIEEILATENPGRPLSDDAIAQMLAERGIKVARRTVNKYRDRTKLLSSRRRRAA
ncbi:MAG: RNA polymerase factor sigma-54 [Armatimonadetes bacterium]|nr:RNA polymerase factor sigma-54 [Armatimonadota bacterium]